MPPVHLPEPVVEPVRPWCGAGLMFDGSHPSTLVHNDPEYLRANVTCVECKALDERTRHRLVQPGSAMLAAIQHAAMTAINSVYGTDDRHAYMALRIAENVIDGKPLPWRYPPGTDPADDPAVDHRPTTPVQCSCGWRETDDIGERTWAEHMAATLADPLAAPVHYNPTTGETSDLR